MSAQQFVLEQYANEAWTSSEKREWQAGPALDEVEIRALEQSPRIGRRVHQEIIDFSRHAEKIRRRWERKADDEYDPRSEVDKTPVKVFGIASGVALVGCFVAILLKWAGWSSLVLMIIGLLVVGGIAYKVWMDKAPWQFSSRESGTLTDAHRQGLAAELDEAQQRFRDRLAQIETSDFELEEATNVLSDRNAAIGVIADKGLLDADQQRQWTQQPLGGVRLQAERRRIEDTPNAQARIESSPVQNQLN